MAKRRTRKQKENARRNFTISWEPSPKRAVDKVHVKRQLTGSDKSVTARSPKQENAKNTANDIDLASIKKDLVKSLILASLILAFEVVLYLLWRKT
jgi:hypothetical protein